jgi:transcriptional regulator with XRE-family HTH domain
MENYENLTAIIAENLIYYRKKAKMTQSEVAAKLCYSDKSVSKWERAEGVPDIHILVQLAKMYGLTVNDFLTKKKKEKIANRFFSRVLITAISVGLVWFVATIAFFVLKFFLPTTSEYFKPWLIFIYAIPVSFIVSIIFSCIYFNKIFTMFNVSGLVWTLALSAYLTFIMYENIGLIFIVMIPFQVLIVFFFILLIRKRKK